MKATEIEIRCIDFSKEIFARAARIRIKELDNKLLPLILTPKAYLTYFVPDYISILKTNPFHKKIIFMILLFTFYLILFPLCFFLWFYEINTKKRYAVQSEIIQLKTYSRFDHCVSKKKTFTQLWEDKGLKFNINTKPIIPSNEVIECINCWFNLLYGQVEEFEKIKQSAQNRLIMESRKFYSNNPHGHIQLKNLEDILPEEIDKLMPPYET